MISLYKVGGNVVDDPQALERFCAEFDGIVAPNLITGNLLIKALQIHGHCSSFGVIRGANIPIAITSRSDPQEQSYLSLAACAAMFNKKA